MRWRTLVDNADVLHIHRLRQKRSLIYLRPEWLIPPIRLALCADDKEIAR